MWWALHIFIFATNVSAYLIGRWTSIRTLSSLVAVVLFVSLSISYCIVILVPYDLCNDGSISQKLLTTWPLIYWMSFVLMWLILPILQAYVESGYYSITDKLKDALKSTLKYHLILCAAAIGGLIYIGVTTDFNFTNIKGLCVALSYLYGLVLVIWMLGQGIVTIPRDLWYGTVGQLKHLYARATTVHGRYMDAQASYDNAVAKVMALDPIKTAKYAPWIDSLITDIRSQDMPLSRAAGQCVQPRDLTSGNLAELSCRYRRELSHVTRARSDWQRLIHEVVRFEELQSGTSTYVHTVRPILVRGAAVVLASLSIVVTWSEIMSSTRLSLVDIIVHHSTLPLKFITAILILGYMCLCVNSSLTSMRVFNLYAIVPEATDEPSLLFFAAYALRLSVPLAYNFLMLTSTQDTIFQEFLGKFVNLTALGEYVNRLLPCLIIIPIFWTLFGVSEMVKEYLGFGLGLDYFDADDLEAGKSVSAAESEGRELVRRALHGINTNSVALGEEQQGDEGGVYNSVVSWLR